MQPQYTTKINLCPYEGFGPMGGRMGGGGGSFPRTAGPIHPGPRYGHAGPNIPHAGYQPSLYPGWGYPVYQPPIYPSYTPAYQPQRRDTTWDPMWGLPSIIISILCIFFMAVAIPRGA